MTKYPFSGKSAAQLASAHPNLQRLFHDVSNWINCAILVGHRGEVDQNEAFATGKSDKRWPDGKHNATPSNAVDAIAYPIDWDDDQRNRMFAAFVMWRAMVLGIKLRWGGDWDGDGDMKDQSLNDLVHFELVQT